jgi:rRNA-processing protein CGR1
MALTRKRKASATAEAEAAASVAEPAPAAEAQQPKRKCVKRTRSSLAAAAAEEELADVAEAVDTPAEEVVDTSEPVAETAAEPEQQSDAAKAAQQALQPQLGRNASGRPWKGRNQSQRAVIQRTAGTKEIGSSWAKKEAERARLAAVRAKEREMKDAKKAEVEASKQAKLEREKRRADNELKSSSYQTITKTHKLKGMSKKQLRQVKKMQVNSKTGAVELVSPWTGKK